MLHMLLAQNAKTVFCFLQGHRVSLTTVLPDLYGAKLPSNLLLFYELLLFFPPFFIWQQCSGFPPPFLAFFS